MTMIEDPVRHIVMNNMQYNEQLVWYLLY